MGIPSVGILLHEVIKLMYHAKVRDPVFFRIGTCGGIGYEGGTVVISEEAVDGALKNTLELVGWHRCFISSYIYDFFFNSNLILFKNLCADSFLKIQLLKAIKQTV